jgi:excisionase family DNA binding protein
MNDSNPNRLLMPYELARVLNVSVSWVRNHAAPSSKKRIPHKKVGGLLRFDLNEVMDWLNHQEKAEVSCER